MKSGKSELITNKSLPITHTNILKAIRFFILDTPCFVGCCSTQFDCLPDGQGLNFLPFVSQQNNKAGKAQKHRKPACRIRNYRPVSIKIKNNQINISKNDTYLNMVCPGRNEIFFFDYTEKFVFLQPFLGA